MNENRNDSAICPEKRDALFLIPARGGSKGIPGKNIRLFSGQPLICRSIEVARQFATDRDICVSTDSTEIRRVAEAAGLPVPFLRPESLATDQAGTHEVMIHALDFYAAQGIEYERIVLLQPTSPLRTAEDVEAAMSLYSPAIDMVVSVVAAKANPYYDIFETDPTDGFLHISKGDGHFTRRQDAPQVWQYNGAVYVINTRSLRQCKMGDFKRRIMLEMPAERSIDLDSLLDWEIAERIDSCRKGK